MTTIDVTVIAYPDGSTVHIRDADTDMLSRASKGWRDSLTDEQRARYERSRAGGGCVIIRMPEEDYNAIPATNHPAIRALSHTDRR